jgi:galactosyl transferase GMA12/MNN10 family
MARDLLIILRTCTSVNMLHGENRYIQVPKQELVNVCASSLVNSINQVENHNIKLVVLDDHSSPEAVEDIKRIVSRCHYPAEFISVEDGTGNAHTMSRVYKLVEERCNDLWYHVEDDYLHQPDAIQDMIDAVDQFERNTGKMVAVNPHDDIWRYREIYESYIILGPYRHYRTVKHTTFTCLASRKIYDKYRQHFQDVVTLTAKKADWVENQSINHVWNKSDVMLFSPIPGLGFHIMDESGIDPYLNIVELWDSIPRLWMQDTTTNVAIVSLFNDKHADLAKYTWTNKQQYAAKHGYQAIAKTADFSEDQVHFDKFIHILDVMNADPNIEWVWWLDNDAMITNFDVRIGDLVNDNFHVIMGVDIAALNTGSFLVRNSMQGRQWLEFLLSKKGEYKNDTKWFEQQAVIDFYPKFQDIFKIVPQRTMNSYDYNIYQVDSEDLLGYSGQWQPGDFVIHWPGLNNQIRVQLAQQYQKQIQDSK